MNPGPLLPVQRKIVRAAARTHLATGATIASHTASGVAAIEQIDLIEEEGAEPGCLIVVHTDDEPDTAFHRRIAERGAWVEYDHLSADEESRYLRWISDLVEAGFADRPLISQDVGWYNVGEPEGGKVVPYDYLPGSFMDALRRHGFADELVQELTVANPARAFSMPGS